MPPVRILPEVLANKIAAGEVVERPASVVKELLENALDAQSSRITVEIENGGKSLIRVADDGVGMSPDDAMLSIERYATSKIAEDKDLFGIKTLGFRGEALPSIASVSRFTLVSRAKSAEEGIQIDIAGGKIRNVTGIGAPTGTMVTVRQLFFNTPGRRKFLKTTATEAAHVADTLTTTALAWPGVHFRLFHNRRTIKDWVASEDPFQRIGDVLGREVRRHLRPLKSSEGSLSLEGWVASPSVSRKTLRSVYVYVNGRFVRDRTVLNAVQKGYRDRLMKGQFPVAVLFLQIPPEEVDVNVHPTKHEVRFTDQRHVHEAVLKAVERALKKAPSPCGYQQGEVPRSLEKTTSLSETHAAFGRRHGSKGGQHERIPTRSMASPVDTAGEDASASATRPLNSAAGPAAAGMQEDLWHPDKFEDLRVIGQFQNAYILCESRDGLVIIDQHAAHERVVYEELKQAAADSPPASQRLLVPETVELSYKGAELLQRLIPEFADAGFDISSFGGNTFVIRAVPAMLAGKAVRTIIVDVIDQLLEVDGGLNLPELVDESLRRMACHHAVRANQRLACEEAKALLRQLDRCENPDHCPHGRPTWRLWDKIFLEKSFKRIT